MSIKRFEEIQRYFRFDNKKIQNLTDHIAQGWATPVTRIELGTRALLSGARARTRKRDPSPSNEKVNNLQVAVLSCGTRCPFLRFRWLTMRYLI